MSKNRLEAFSDGVIAILLTIMVLDLRPPAGAGLEALWPVLPAFMTYVVSYAYLAIYWNNHHHMLQMTSRITGTILWANLHLLFWLSLVPFATSWVAKTGFAELPTALYGVVLLLSGIAYLLMQRAIVADQGPGSRLAAAVGRDVKGKLSAILYAAAVAAAFVRPSVSHAIYVLVALMWLVPDRRIESRIGE